MSTSIEQLLNIQERDRRIARLTQESLDIPARKDQAAERLDEHKHALEAAQEELMAATASQKEVELEVEACQEKITKYRQQQYETKKNEEYKALENEIKTMEKQIQGLEDKEIEIMERIEGIKGKIKDCEADLKASQEIVDGEAADLDQRLQKIQGEIDQLKGDRDGLLDGVDEEWLDRYQRIFANKGQAIVPVEKDICGGCHMRIPPQQVNDAKKWETMTPCPYCGCLLYCPR